MNIWTSQQCKLLGIRWGFGSVWSCYVWTSASNEL